MKDFDKWNEIKKEINNKSMLPQFSEREVWWCILGTNIGYEEDGKGEDYLRPVLIVRKFNKSIFYGLPITSRLKTDKFHASIKSGEIFGSVILSQMRLIDARRLGYLFGKITEVEFCGIKKKLKNLIP